jgi:hypothetical protein
MGIASFKSRARFGCRVPGNKEASFRKVAGHTRNAATKHEPPTKIQMLKYPSDANEVPFSWLNCEASIGRSTTHEHTRPTSQIVK